MEKNEIAIFICEDDKIARKIVDKYLDKEKVTYVAFESAKRRKDIVKFLNSLA